MLLILLSASLEFKTWSIRAQRHDWEMAKVVLRMGILFPSGGAGGGSAAWSCTSPRSDRRAGEEASEPTVNNGAAVEDNTESESVAERLL